MPNAKLKACFFQTVEVYATNNDVDTKWRQGDALISGSQNKLWEGAKTVILSCETQ
jgi:hypothetical protein